jgi:hypothetical protein
MPPARNKYLWTNAHQQRYDAVYNYLKNSLRLNIDKETFVETITPRLLYKYIIENPKWADSTKENYLFAIARKLNILKKTRHAKWFSEQAHKLQLKRADEEGRNGLDIKEEINWRPHQYFVDLINTLKQDGNVSITQHMKVLLLTLLTYQPPLRTSFYTTALLIREKEANDKKHNYVYINRRGSSKVQYIVNKDKASNYKLYNMNKNLSFIDVEGEAKKAILESYENFPRNYLFEINNNPITDSTLLRWLREISGVSGLTIDIMRSSYITWYYEMHPHYNDRDKLSKLMRHSQKTAQLNYNKVFTTEHKEDDCRETKKTLIERDRQLKELLIQLDAYKNNKPDNQNFKKRRRDIAYHLNTKGRTPRDSTLKKYDMKYSSELKKYI